MDASNAFRFWFPLWTRDAPVRNLLWRIRSARDRSSSAKMSVIAHRFGTYAIGNILRDNPDIRLHRLILCGAILPSNFRWDQIQRSVETPIINDCGIKDIWPVLAQSTTFGYGPSGRFGFGTPGVRDRYHDFGHGGFFKEKFVSDFWLPWFRGGNFVKSKAPPPSGTRWHLLTLIQIKWLAILLCVLGVFWFAKTHVTLDNTLATVGGGCSQGDKELSDLVNKYKYVLRSSHVLWVDDKNRNQAERQCLEEFGIQFDLAESTQEAITTLSWNKGIDLVISNMSRPPDPDAGNTLIKEIDGHHFF
jgi:hypothetical protein